MADTEDYRGEEAEYDPTAEPKSSKAWLNLITDAERAFQTYQDKCDNVDKQYADLSRMANLTREREFQMFWANVQVIGPSIYSRPPVPVVVPKFRDRRPLYRVTSELLERVTVIAFEKEDIDHTMRLVRDDLTINARGAAWVRYETKSESDTNVERVVLEHLDRKDFLHDPARHWREVDWVARRGWMTRKEMRERFRKTSGDAYKEAAYAVMKEDRDNGAADKRLKAGVWEIWCRSMNKVFWVTEGVDVMLDEGEPHLKVEGFFPCPKPAYSTVQRRSLIPVPDMVYYKDQLEEINELTGRISALAAAIKLRAFYPAGAGEIGDAIEAAIKSTDDRLVMIPISNWAAFGGGTTKDTIVWLPIDMVAGVVAQLVELRRQLIDDVYQITGLSDIMRGATDPNETLGAQQLKSQYGSIRVRDRQDELVRFARDLTRLTAEIMAEEFNDQTLLDMSQMEIPTDAEIREQIEALGKQAKQIGEAAKAQIAQAAQDPKMRQMAEQNPEQAQQMAAQVQQQAQQQMGQLQAQAEELSQTVTVEQVMELLREQRLRPFILDIETDSTIAPDENAQKQRATEFITAIGGFLSQALPSVQMVPQSAGLMGDTLKYVASQFRAGRELDTSIDEFAESMKAMGQQPQANPEADAQKAADAEKQAQIEMESKRLQMDEAKAQAEEARKAQEDARKAEMHQLDTDIKTGLAKHQFELSERESAEKLAAIQEQRANAALKHAQDMDKGTLELRKMEKEMQRMAQQAVFDAQKAEQSATLMDRKAQQKPQGTPA